MVGAADDDEEGEDKPPPPPIPLGSAVVVLHSLHCILVVQLEWYILQFCRVLSHAKRKLEIINLQSRSLFPQNQLNK
jgi:hypothetical protein